MSADEFEGKDIVTGTGDGLSKAIQTRPTVIHHGDEVFLLIRAVGQKVRFDRSKDDPDELVRVQILKAETVAIVDAEFARESIAAQRAAEDRAAGREPLPFEESANAIVFGGDEDGTDRDAAGFFGQPDDEIEDLPWPEDLAAVDAPIARMLEAIPEIVDVAQLRRWRVAEVQVHNAIGRKSILKAIDNRLDMLAQSDADQQVD